MKEYLIKDEILEIKYEQGKGAWTYYLQIPNTRHIKGKWGTLKVAGVIDNYPIDCINLFKTGDADKIISINQKIRTAIGKTAGDSVRVSLYWYNNALSINQEEILETLKEAEVFAFFEKLPKEEQETFFQAVISEKNQDQQTQIIIKMIEKLKKFF